MAWRTNANRTSKAEKLDNPGMRVVSKHTEQEILQELINGGDYLSIDPAQINYGLRVEWRPSLDSRVQKILPRHFIRANIAELATRANSFLTIALSKFLDGYNFRNVYLAVIERQLPQNEKSTWIAHHTQCYLTMKYPQMIVIDLAPTFKSRILNAPKGLNKTALKKWSVERAFIILEQRKDQKSLRYLRSERKQDDLADTIIQLEAVFVYFSRQDTDVIITNDLYPRIGFTDKARESNSESDSDSTSYSDSDSD